MSVKEKLFNIVQLGDVKLLEKYIDEECQDYDWMNIAHKKTGDTLLNYAARAGNRAIIQYLHSTGMSLETGNFDGKTALHEAAQFGHLAVVQYLIQHCVEIDSLRRGDWTPGMLACTKDNTCVVKLLLENGANTTLRNKDGWTMFHIATREGHVDILDHFIKRKKNCWMTCSNNGRTPLHTAAFHGKTDAVALLIRECECPVDHKDSCGSTPLMDALRGGYLDIADVLIKHGASSSEVDAMGRRSLHLAAQVGCLSAIKFLITECDAEVNYQSLNSGVTALHLAAKEGQVAAVDLLLEHGAQISAKDQKGRTALHLASGGQHLDCVRLLLTRGAQDQEDDDGRTALSLARKDPIKEILAHHSAN